MKKILFTLLAILLLFNQLNAAKNNVVADDEEDVSFSANADTNEQNNESDQGFEQVESENPNIFKFENDGEMSLQDQLDNFQEQLKQQQASAEFQKNAVAICLIMAKLRMQNEVEYLQKIVQSRPDSAQLYKKIQNEHIDTCLNSVLPEEFNKIATEINEQTFDIKNYEQKFMELTFSRYEQSDFNTQLTDREQHIDKIAQEWEAEWKSKQEEKMEKEFIDQQHYVPTSEDYEPKLFGYSFSDIPAYIKYGVFFGVFATVSLITLSGLQYLSKNNQVKTKSQLKKQKKKSQ